MLNRLGLAVLELAVFVGLGRQAKPGGDSITCTRADYQDLGIESARIIVVVGGAAATVVAGDPLGFFIAEPEDTCERRGAARIGGSEGYTLILQG